MENKIHPAVAALIVIVLIGTSAGGVLTLKNRTASNDVPMNSQPTGTNITSSGSSDGQSYADGTYTANGSYFTPGGKESIGLSVTLKFGAILSASLEERASGGETAIYQGKFAAGYKPLVIGKNIDDIKLDRVAGSSLTSDGFNTALESIKRDAAR